MSQEKLLGNRLFGDNLSPSRRVGQAHTAGISANTNKLHEKVTWFYRRLCEEYDCPILPQFI